MERLTKPYNERTGTYENIDAFGDAGRFDSIMKGITFNFVKETAQKVRIKALEAATDKVGRHVEEFAANKAISAVNSKFSKQPKQVKTLISKETESDEESSKPLGLKDSTKPMGNLIMKN